MEGVEPTHSYEYQILSLAHLPIPPHRPWPNVNSLSAACKPKLRNSETPKGDSGFLWIEKTQIELGNQEIRGFEPESSNSNKRPALSGEAGRRFLRPILPGQIINLVNTLSSSRDLARASGKPLRNSARVMFLDS